MTLLRRKEFSVKGEPIFQQSKECFTLINVTLSAQLLKGKQTISVYSGQLFLTSPFLAARCRVFALTQFIYQNFVGEEIDFALKKWQLSTEDPCLLFTFSLVFQLKIVT